MTQLSGLLRDIKVVTRDLKSPEAKSKRLAGFARAEIAKAQAINGRATGADAPYEVAVDGRKGASIDSVRSDGVIVATFDLVNDVLEWIGAMLVKESPVLTGRYAASHMLFADGVAHDPGDPLPQAGMYIFVNTQPYARKIERGLSAQAPDGVYQAIAAVAKNRFGNVAKVRFSYRSLTGSKSKANGQPAIVVVTS